MGYVVDVITCADRLGFQTLWRSHAQRLAGCPGFQRAELFEMQREIRDACYDFVAVFNWRNGADPMLPAGDEGGEGVSAPGNAIAVKPHLSRPRVR